MRLWLNQIELRRGARFEMREKLEPLKAAAEFAQEKFSGGRSGNKKAGALLPSSSASGEGDEGGGHGEDDIAE